MDIGDIYTTWRNSVLGAAEIVAKDLIIESAIRYCRLIMLLSNPSLLEYMDPFIQVKNIILGIRIIKHDQCISPINIY